MITSFQAGASFPDKEGELPLHYCIRNNVPRQVIDCLLEAYPDGLKAVGRSRDLPLHLALETCGIDDDLILRILSMYPESSKEELPGRPSSSFGGETRAEKSHCASSDCRLSASTVSYFPRWEM